MMNQLILNKSELKNCRVAVIQSLHSSKRHAYPENQAVYVIDPLYQEVLSDLTLHLEWSFISGSLHF